MSQRLPGDTAAQPARQADDSMVPAAACTHAQLSKVCLLHAHELINLNFPKRMAFSTGLINIGLKPYWMSSGQHRAQKQTHLHIICLLGSCDSLSTLVGTFLDHHRSRNALSGYDQALYTCTSLAGGAPNCLSMSSAATQQSLPFRFETDCLLQYYCGTI